MKNLILAGLCATILTTASNASAQLVEGISDIEVPTDAVHRIKFDCPPAVEKQKDRPLGKGPISSAQSQLKDCWAELTEDTINIMNLQSIKRQDIIRHWYVTTRDFGGCNYSNWYFLYQAQDGVRRNFVMRKKDCGWKNSKTGETESLYINNWLAR